MKLFIDESGNNGDVNLATISDQPFFTLCGVIISEKFEFEYVKLENSYKASKGRLQQQEIKSSNTYNSNISFTKDVISLLLEHRLPVFAEITDKRYFLFANMVTYTIMPLSLKSAESSIEKYKSYCNKIADHLYFSARDHLIAAYNETCKFPSTANFLLFLDVIERDVLKDSNELREGLECAINSLRKMVKQAEFKPDQLLPNADKLKSGKNHWMIPYIPSFSSLYARVNNFMQEQSISSIEIYHDEQHQYDDIIRQCKDTLESNKFSKLLNQNEPYRSFNFENQNNIHFVSSKSNKLIQVADILAGFINRSCYRKFAGTLPEEYDELLYDLINFETPPIGLNFVMPEKEINRIRRSILHN